MVSEKILETINYVGDKVSQITQLSLQKINEFGFLTNDWTARILSIIVLGALLYLTLFIGQSLKPAIKWGIKILFILLIISVVLATFIN